MPATTAIPDRLGLRLRFPALSYANYRLWLVARGGWTLSMGMRALAQGYLVYELTHSAAILLVAALSVHISYPRLRALE